MISPDGRFVSFESEASNLVEGDTNGVSDIFVHDRESGETTRVSVASDGAQGNDYSDAPAISEGGRFVAFQSRATNLVPNDSNGYQDIFVHDQQTGETTLVSVSSDGTPSELLSQVPSITPDGRFVVFGSGGSLVAEDTNGVMDTYVHDRQTGETKRVSVSSNGTQGNSHSYPSSNQSISADGRFVVFDSHATNLVSGDTNGFFDVFVHDRQTGETTRVSLASDGSQANWDAFYGVISGNGRFVAFQSYADNLVSGDTNEFLDIFLHDRHIGSTIRVSVPAKGLQAAKNCLFPTLSADGTLIGFSSNAWNLIDVDEDKNGFDDVYLRLLGLEN